MTLLLRRHAAERMMERYLDEWDVMRTIAFPDEVQEGEHGTMVSKKALGMKHITVVWHLDARGNHIVHTII